MKKAGKVQKYLFTYFSNFYTIKSSVKNCFQEGGAARVNKKVMYAVIGVIAVFLVIAVIILLGRGSRAGDLHIRQELDAGYQSDRS